MPQQQTQDGDCHCETVHKHIFIKCEKRFSCYEIFLKKVASEIVLKVDQLHCVSKNVVYNFRNNFAKS